MRRDGFDSPNTCPKIDSEIASAKSVINAFIDDLLEEAYPLLSNSLRREFAENYASGLYLNLEDCFETVRATNVEMRDEANRQISALQEEIADLESALEEARSEV